MKNKILLFVPISLLLLLSSYNISYKSNINSLDSTSSKKVILSFVGDIMCHTPQMDYARVDKDSFDFKPVFREVKKYLSASDLSFGNLETVIGVSNSKYTGYPLFNSPEELLEALSDSGFDILFTSNNHSLDRGIKGLFNTIDQIKKYNLIQVGTYKSQKDRDSVLIVDIKGIRIGIKSYSYGLNGNYLPKDSHFAVNLIDTSLIKNDLTSLNNFDTDLNIVYFHFGDEYSHKPSSFQKSIVEKTFSYGADIIIASHPHVLQPIQYYEKGNGNIRKGIVAYSLGNFISNQRWRYSDSGAILNIEVTKNQNDSIWISQSSIIPTWVFKGNSGIKNEFIILPSDTLQYKLPDYLSSNDRSKLIQSFNDAHSKNQLMK